MFEKIACIFFEIDFAIENQVNHVSIKFSVVAKVAIKQRHEQHIKRM